MALYRNRDKNVYDPFGGRGPGAFAKFLVNTGVTRRFQLYPG